MELVVSLSVCSSYGCGLVGVDEDENLVESYRERGERDRICLGSMVGLSSMHMRCLPFGKTTYTYIGRRSFTPFTPLWRTLYMGAVL